MSEAVLAPGLTSNVGSDSVALGEASDLGSHLDDGSDGLVSRDELGSAGTSKPRQRSTHRELGDELSLVDVSL